MKVKILKKMRKRFNFWYSRERNKFVAIDKQDGNILSHEDAFRVVADMSVTLFGFKKAIQYIRRKNLIVLNQIAKLKREIFAFFVSIIISSCTSVSDFEIGKKQLEQAGYTEIKNTGHQYFCCSEDENFSTGFKCYDKDSQVVEGCFCSDIFKGVTIRFK